MCPNKNYDVLVAKCGRTVGLRGALKLIAYTDFSEIFNKKIRLFCDGTLLTIDKFDANRMIIQFEEINNIDDAKLLNSRLLYMTREETRRYCHIESNEYFWFDIIGCKVFDDDNFIGDVTDITRIGNTDYLIIRINNNLIFELNLRINNFMIPYIDRYILDVDLKIKRINVIDSMGILENSQ